MIANPVEWFYKANPHPWGFIRSRSGSLFRLCLQHRDDTDGITAVAICQATNDFAKRFGPVTEENAEHYRNYVNNAIYFAIIGEFSAHKPTASLEHLDAAIKDPESIADQLAPAMSFLTEFEQVVIRHTFGVETDKKSILETSRLLSKTVYNIRQTRYRAFIKMRAFLRNREV